MKTHPAEMMKRPPMSEIPALEGDIFFEKFQKRVDIYYNVWCNIITGKEVSKMEEITKALRDLAKAIENQKAVESVRISITLKKQKSDKASKDE